MTPEQAHAARVFNTETHDMVSTIVRDDNGTYTILDPTGRVLLSQASAAQVVDYFIKDKGVFRVSDAE